MVKLKKRTTIWKLAWRSSGTTSTIGTS